MSARRRGASRSALSPQKHAIETTTGMCRHWRREASARFVHAPCPRSDPNHAGGAREFRARIPAATVGTPRRRQRAVRIGRRAAHDGEKLVHAILADRAHGHDLLRQHIQGIAGVKCLFDVAVQHSPRRGRARQEVGAVFGNDDAARRPSHLMMCAADALQTGAMRGAIRSAPPFPPIRCRGRARGNWPRWRGADRSSGVSSAGVIFASTDRVAAPALRLAFVDGRSQPFGEPRLLAKITRTSAEIATRPLVPPAQSIAPDRLRRPQDRKVNREAADARREVRLASARGARRAARLPSCGRRRRWLPDGAARRRRTRPRGGPLRREDAALPRARCAVAPLAGRRATPNARATERDAPSLGGDEGVESRR